MHPIDADQKYVFDVSQVVSACGRHSDCSQAGNSDQRAKQVARSHKGEVFLDHFRDIPYLKNSVKDQRR